MFALGMTIFGILFVAGMPIWVVMLCSGMFLAIFDAHLPLVNLGITILSGVDSFTLMAIPFFLISGNIMAYCGPSKKIYDVVNKFIGWLPGGLAMTSIGMAMIYAAITGSSTATLAGVTRIAVPPMLEAGYDKKFCAGMLAVSCTLGQLIPPSIYMITYGVLANQNAARLFMSGFVPGVLVGFSFMGYSMFWSLRNKSKLAVHLHKYTMKERMKSLLEGAPALAMPVFVLVGIYAGWFTPTEAAGVSAAYALLISGPVYKNLTWQNFKEAVYGSVNSLGMIFMLIASSIVFSQPLAFARIPQKISEVVVGFGLGQTGVILITLVLWLIMGMFLDPMPILYLTLPIMLPTLIASGVNLIHFNVLTVVAMQIANVTPPFGINLYVASSMVGVEVQDTIKSMMPFLIILIIWLFLLIFFPGISLFLPNMM